MIFSPARCPASGAPARALAFALIGMLAQGFALPAAAQAWPSKPVRLIVPFPAGNAGDVTARTLIDQLGARLGQPIIVDNRPGAAGTIGMEAVKKSPPDGYTLLVTSLSPLVVNPVVMKSLPYDPIKDFQPVARIGWTGLMMVANIGFSANTVQELVAMAKAAPGKYNYAHIGAGTLSHLTMELFLQAAGIDVVGIPYKGSSQALTDVVGGQVPLMFDGMTSANVQVKAGKLKGLAVSSPRRSVFAPNVPTLAESGVPALKDVEVTGWTGLLGPAGLPRDLVNRLNADINAIVQTQDIRDRYAAQNLEVFPPGSADDFAAYIRAESEKWKKVGRDANIQPQ
jgi:tripartite-type tricarboxylate transporter receptor subunit TctC